MSHPFLCLNPPPHYWGTNCINLIAKFVRNMLYSRLESMLAVYPCILSHLLLHFADISIVLRKPLLCSSGFLV
jgi:hypothetical protein